MPAPAITLEVLPAGYGDCLLVTCPVGRRRWRMLVDTGPDEVFPALKARLAKLPADRLGKRHIDLFVVTHIDHDHIGGAALLLNDRSLGLTFGDIWFNAPPRPAARGVAEGQSLAELLGATAVALPWNKAFAGQPAATSGDGAFMELPGPPGAPRLTLLSPTPRRLQNLYKVWDRELERLRRKEPEKPSPAPMLRGLEELDLDALAARVTATDHAVPNGSSIALLLEHRGASALLGADAIPDVMVPAVQALARQRKQPAGLAIDAIKLSHHGSRGNTTNDLLKAMRADHYVFSTNNAIFNHPDDEAVARVVTHAGRMPTLWFNYATARNARWAADALRNKYGYGIQLPANGQAGVSLALPAR